MRFRDVDLLQISICIPTVPYDLSIKELRGVFEELKIYKYLTVLKNNTPIGIVYRDQVEKVSNDKLTAGEVTSLCCRLRNTSVRWESIVGIFELLPLEREPVIVTDKKGTYLGILTYDTVLHFISHHREHVLPVIQRVHTSLGKEEHLCIFGLKNVDKFREIFGPEKAGSLYKMLMENIKDILKGEMSGVPEREELWILSSVAPSKEDIKELFKEFYREYSLLFSEPFEVHIYGFCVNLAFVNSQEKLYQLNEELRNRVKKIEGSVFIVHGLQPTLILHDPKRQKLITNIKRRILDNLRDIVEHVRATPREMWEYVLYDMFDKYPYFELFYIMGERGLQITNNIVNPKADYVIVQGKKGSDRSEKPYFRRALMEGIFISEVYLSKATDDFCITVSARFSYEGKTYVLAGDINFKQIHKLIRTYKEIA